MREANDLRNVQGQLENKQKLACKIFQTREDGESFSEQSIGR